MGNLVADAMLDRTKTQGISIAIQNGGGLRASIGAGDVSMGDVLTVLPFQNTIATFQLTGAEVKAALENGLSQIDEGAGRFPQVAGLKYSFDKTKPAGSRLVSVEVQEGTEFKPIDPEKTYGIVSNNYMRAGGDGYAVFAKDGKNAYDFGPNLESVVADYLGAHNPYKPYTDGRITQVGTVAATAQPAPAKPADATQQAAPEQKPAPAADGGAASSTTPPASSPPTVTTPSTTMPTNPTATPSTPPKSDPAASTPATAAPATETPATSAPATSAPAATTPETTAPAAAASEPPKTPTTTPTTHVIVAGDTLWDIAKTYYGNANQWHKLVAANRNIKPHHLTIGEKLRVPTK